MNVKDFFDRGLLLRKMPPPWVGQASRYHLVSCCCWMGSIDQKPESIALAKMLVFIPQRSYIVRITGLLNGIALDVLALADVTFGISPTRARNITLA